MWIICFTSVHTPDSYDNPRDFKQQFKMKPQRLNDAVAVEDFQKHSHH